MITLQMVWCEGGSWTYYAATPRYLRLGANGGAARCGHRQQARALSGEQRDGACARNVWANNGLRVRPHVWPDNQSDNQHNAGSLSILLNSTYCSYSTSKFPGSLLCCRLCLSECVASRLAARSWTSEASRLRWAPTKDVWCMAHWRRDSTISRSVWLLSWRPIRWSIRTVHTVYDL